MTATTTPDALWNAERRLAGTLGYALFVKTEPHPIMGGYVAVARLEPRSARAKLIATANRATAIEGRQDFPDMDDAVYALGDAIREALALAKDAA